MHLIINGQDYDNLPDTLTVAALLEHLNLPGKKIAIECNLEIIPKSTFETHQFSAGDRLEIIHFIGGG